jgi:cAMP-dependent protein kinase regulator
MLATLTEYELLTIADSLTPEEFSDGTEVVKEGDAGDAFYIIEAGTAVCKQTPKNLAGSDGTSAAADATATAAPVAVGTLSAGGYFGEISLLTSKPRQVGNGNGNGNAIQK